MRHTSFPLLALGGLTALLLSLASALSVPTRPAAVPVGDEAEPHPAAPVSAATSPRQQLLARMGVDRWHAAGVRGHGAKVAVIDTGFRGWRNFLGKVLPAHVTAHSFRADGNLEFRDSQHGILCGEVIHALAPDAELLFANWEPGHEDQFLAAVRWAKQQGAHVISVSVIAPSWSDGEGGGDVHRALTALLADDHGGMLCFASAGNTTERHWCGTFADGGDGWHAWKPGLTANGLRPWSDERVHVELYGKAGGVYELVVLDAATE
ncbi:MAG TPA: S8 family serine peptidase, partial [Gemmataceae bacterium]|nr:S8 family serine peptidase [Gemmataceae bacterium]